MENLLNIGAEALRKAALNEEAKDFLLNNDVLFKILKKAANRYIGGETLEETVWKVITENINGFKCSIEFMGENVKTEPEASEATTEFVNICQSIISQNLNSTISLDLSHIGLGISRDLGLQNLLTVCEAASGGNIEVIISAEGTEQTDHILETYMQASKKYNNLAVTLQAYLYRTQDDFEDIIKEKGRIRIVKGAFETAAGLSIPRGEMLDEIYLGYIDKLMSANHKCSVATHDDKIQQEVKKLIGLHNPEKNSYEFESLYGIQTSQLTALKNEGYPTKMYFVYGREWYLYLCNRIAEYPLNLFQAVADIVAKN
ncbi:proline dehydrogenase family protein [Dyadobacter sp. CY345]|uniref:proline dehydrogenase family protein n=1 Tax=Dyadobacter sp. CY345 TaxID=2909335 RepID=UPI001F21CF37|nr:proline dehydrogenase family protein [Dyadobacter sp. CY345]MCF2446364.1 proline dehydrogenase family protein [Dyadobacter sp. CY345]